MKTKHVGLFISAIAGASLFALVGFSGVAHADTPASGECATVGSTVVDYSYYIANDPDSGTFGGNWALDTFDRHIQIWPENSYYCAKATDSGTFTTTGNSPTGTTLSQPITGTMAGAVTIKTAVAPTTTASIPNPDCSVSGQCDGLTGKWITYYFGDTAPASGYDWGWTYTAPTGEAWVNAAAGNSGDIHPVFDSTTNVGYSDLQSAITAANSGDTIKLAGNITTAAEVNVTKPLTIDGNGFTLNAHFAKTDNSNNSAIGIGSNDVTIKNLVEDATGGTNLHGINVYQSTGVTLDGVTVSNNRAGVIVNGSVVTVNNITTSNNSWGGINVDQGGGVTAVTTLIVNGTSHHSESTAIWIDDVSKTDVSVVDTNNQYVSKSYTHDAGVVGKIYQFPVSVAPTAGTPVAITAANTVPVVVNIPADVTDAKLDLVTLKTAPTPDTAEVTTPSVITVNSDTVDFAIPSGTVITSSSGWNGTIELPHVSTQTIAPAVAADQTASVGLAISVGSDTETLTFSNAVRLVLSGQASKRVGFAHSDGVFTEITDTCAADTQVAGDALAAGAECKIDVGSDLVVWTKHFTTFATYSVTASTPASASTVISSARSGGGSALRAVRIATAPNAAPAAGRVLGAATFRFSESLARGASSDAVMELQNRLKEEGFFTVAPTGYFGPITLAAVKAYQASKSLPSTGFVGSLTIAKLNESASNVAGVAASMSIKDFVDLLITSGIISSDKAAAAKTWTATSN